MAALEETKMTIKSVIRRALLFAAIAVVVVNFMFTSRQQLKLRRATDDIVVVASAQFSNLLSSPSNSALRTTSSKLKDKSSCDLAYRYNHSDYQHESSWPERNESASGNLPYLADFFASEDAQWAYFIGVNRAWCSEEYKQTDRWYAQGDTGYRFMCVFPEQVHVISEYVQPSTPFDVNYIIKCRIPKQFQFYVQAGQTHTALHVDLHVIDNPELPPKDAHARAKVSPFPSSVVTETPKLASLPICHPAPHLPQHFQSNDNNYENKNQQQQPEQKRLFNLTAFTRVKSSYLLNHYTYKPNVTDTSSPTRLRDWIDYHHQQQGFDHFIIYDNDEAQDRGAIEEAVRPYVQAGLVTYRWVPFADCYDPKSQSFRAIGQGAAGLSALHRMGYATKYFAHMDVDEFFVPYSRQDAVSNKSSAMARTTLDLVDKVFHTKKKSNKTYDVIAFRPTVLQYCNGTRIDNNAEQQQHEPGGQHPTNSNANNNMLAMRKCLTDQHRSDIKLIMRPDSMFSFFVHYATLTKKWTKPTVYMVNDETEGFLAHYRGGVPKGKDIELNKYTNVSHHMDQFLATRRSIN